MAVTLVIRYDLNFAVLVDRDTRVCGTKINAHHGAEVFRGLREDQAVPQGEHRTEKKPERCRPGRSLSEAAPSQYRCTYDLRGE